MAIKGLDSFLDVVEVISNKEKYESKVKELQGLVKQYTEVVEAVVALAAVNDYTQNIKLREEESKIVLENAKAAAKTIVDKANQKTAAADSSIKAREVELLKEANDLDEYKKRLDTDAVNQASEAQALLKWKEELDQRALKLTQDESVLAEKQAKLKAALA